MASVVVHLLRDSVTKPRCYGCGCELVYPQESRLQRAIVLPCGCANWLLELQRYALPLIVVIYVVTAVTVQASGWAPLGVLPPEKAALAMMAPGLVSFYVCAPLVLAMGLVLLVVSRVAASYTDTAIAGYGERHELASPLRALVEGHSARLGQPFVTEGRDDLLRGRAVAPDDVAQRRRPLG